MKQNGLFWIKIYFYVIIIIVVVNLLVEVVLLITSVFGRKSFLNLIIMNNMVQHSNIMVTVMAAVTFRSHFVSKKKNESHSLI